METLLELDKIGADLLAKMPDILQKGAEYGGDLFERFIQYHLLPEYIALGFGVVAVVIGGYFFSALIKHWVMWSKSESTDYWGDTNTDIRKGVSMIVGGILLLIGALNVFVSLVAIVKIKTIPEVYVIKQLVPLNN